MKHQRFLAQSLCISLAAFSLAGCQTLESLKQDILSIDLPSLDNATERSAKAIVYDGQCPSVEIVDELKSLSQFTTPTTKSDDNLVSRVRIENLSNTCEFDENSVTINTAMDFAGTLGPEARNQSSFSYPFFIAVTSAGGNILAKEIFTAPITFKSGTTSEVYSEKMRQVIPLENRDKGYNYKILVGLQLTPDQLSYNRWAIAETKREAEEAQMFAQKDDTEKREIEDEKLRLEVERLRLENEKIAFEEKKKQDELAKEAERQRNSFWNFGSDDDVQEETNKQIFIGRPLEITK